mgnify:CR=1 FL=1
MSRIGRKPITVPSGVKVTIDGRTVTVTGPKGTLSRDLPGVIAIVAEGDVLQLTRPSDSKTNRSLHGLGRLIRFTRVGVNVRQHQPSTHRLLCPFPRPRSAQLQQPLQLDGFPLRKCQLFVCLQAVLEVGRINSDLVLMVLRV